MTPGVTTTRGKGGVLDDPRGGDRRATTSVLGMRRPQPRAAGNRVVRSLDARRFAFGGTAAIATSMGLIVGLGAATAARTTIVSGLLIIAVADNLSDSLSIHLYQEAERLDGRAAFRATLTNFVARLLVALTFVAVVITLPPPWVSVATLAWGVLLLGGLTYLLARERGVAPLPEVGKHLGVALAVILASRAIGNWILLYVG